MYAFADAEKQSQNKPNQTQNKPNSNPIYKMPEMNVNKVLTKNYGKNSPGWLRKNKPNSNPIRTRRSLRVNSSESSNRGPIAVLKTVDCGLREAHRMLIRPEKNRDYTIKRPYMSTTG